MSKVEAFATKLPVDLKKILDLVCEKLGLRKNFVVESALREKLEDLLDTHDLDQAIREATGFHSCASIKKETQLKG
jgi:predicted DNA-binding protein